MKNTKPAAQHEIQQLESKLLHAVQQKIAALRARRVR